MENKNEILSDSSERFQYNISGFPIFCKKFDNSGERACDSQYPCHWHPEIQLVYVLEGTFDHFINGEIVHMSGGQGVFINSRRMHYGIDTGPSYRTFISVMYHPNMFANSSDVVDKYLRQKFSANSIDYMLLLPEIDWQKSVLDNIVKLHGEITSENPDAMRLFSRISDINADICSNIPSVPCSETDHHMQQTFLKMADLINSRYRERITISDLARAGAVSESKCYQLFNQFVHLPPATYIAKYRLTKSTELLRDTKLPITEIALACGFQSSSYFIKLFKREFDETPLKFRERLQADSH